MDELDQLVTKNQSVMYNFFNWPNLRHSRLIVLAVANTMDLPERTLSNKISSRLGLTRITFPGYSHSQLQQIIQSRLEFVPGNIVDPDAIQFASRKVAAVSGDARRALDICRRAVEIAETEAQEAEEEELPPTPSKHARAGGGVASVPAAASARGRVKIATIKQAINEATSSPLLVSLPLLPLASKLLLASLLSLTRRTGLAESTMGEVLEEARKLGAMGDCPGVERYLMGGVGGRVRGLEAAAVELMEAGVVGLEVGKGERTSKVRLGVGGDEVMAGLRGDIEIGRLIPSVG
jgi:origin recognition complex subunit 1